jgi:hypothetical protein
LLEFFILHLQLDLVDLQFVEQVLRAGVACGPARSRVLVPQALFGVAANFGGSGREVQFLVHGEVV